MRVLTILSLAITPFLTPIATQAGEDVIVVYDASGSMWGQIDGVNKVEIARDVMSDLVANWPDDTDLGLVAYGHRSKGDCGDIETVVAPGALDREAFMATVNGIQPKGKTPLAASVEHAAEALAYHENKATVVLISDGIENCEADPCALSTQLAQQGVDFKTHVVGFDLESEAHKELACIAENTGGIFVSAQDATELREALAEVQNVIDLKPTAPAPEPEPTAQIEVTAPNQVIIGAQFDVSWSVIIDKTDYVGIVPKGAEEGETGKYVLVRDDLEGELTAPAEPGLYEVRYTRKADRATLGSIDVEVTETTVSLDAPKKVTAGSTFKVAWSKRVNKVDYVSIVPKGAEEGETGNYVLVRDNDEGELTAPAEPGLYEVRYTLKEGRRTLGSTDVEVTETTVSLDAPKKVTAGSTFKVAWSKRVNKVDYVSIVPKGAEEGETGNYVLVRDNDEGELTAPAEPGLYEVRYTLKEGRRTLGSTDVEVVVPDVSVTGPSTVRAKSPIKISWSQTVNKSDYISIVPLGSPDDETGDYLIARDNTEGQMAAPAEPGLYEVRYVLREGRVVLARDRVEVVDADAPLDEGAGLSVPEQAAPGKIISVSWTGGSESEDQRISLARVDQADFSWIEAKPAGVEQAVQFTMPDDPGNYEVRYLDLSEGIVLGRAVVKVQ
ncbi:hypothetical protein MXMO3_03604 (plasmid) [Maritalea myrionectae]|uniref:VWFA domain-containing protein n=1 Tax=Maritalea myrionectae TaxID=454601 RepID=A0A2R4MJD4_9HYPH|nr:VWA domain-containing protein [Maritalea myrionectae]AVX06107.1 hypothetical protein MXMO3_03604 [Maritalea myrionectae]